MGRYVVEPVSYNGFRHRPHGRRRNPDSARWITYRNYVSGILLQKEARGAADLRLRLVDECGDLLVTETVRLMLKFGFDELELRKVYTQLRKVGQRDMVWLEKMGFRQEGGTREAFHPGAEDHEIAVMGLLRKDYRG